MESTIKVIRLEGSEQTHGNAIDITGLSPEQLLAYEKFIKGENLFITGPGGTGKTKLIKHFVEYGQEQKKNIAVCAMTGCAAILLQCNAKTLHSWSGIKLAKGPRQKIIDAVSRSKYAMKAWKTAKCLILDEISMLSKKIFEIIEEIARKIRKSNAPFGGLQVVFTGDFFQLPPVGTDGEPDTERFCFESPVWEQVFPKDQCVELKTIFRQTDREYIDALLQIRKGMLDKSNCDMLRTYLRREYNPENHNGCIPTKLFPLRSKVDFVNSQMFSKITEPEFVSEVIRRTDCVAYMDSGKAIPKEVLSTCSQLRPTELEYELEQLINSTPCPQVLRLKKGAAVMCTVNLDMENSICNGSQGIVINILENGTPIVRFSNGIVKTMVLHYWQSEEYPTVAIGQYPLCLAWALTIHKIQGATLEMAEIDIGQSVFEYGQTYVALSRVQSLKGLYLSGFQEDKICAHPKALEFYNNL
jgi:ATP-dependent DNA helicase PIF1